MNLDEIRNALQVAPISTNYPQANTLRGTYGGTTTRTREPRAAVPAPGMSMLNSWEIGNLAPSQPTTEAEPTTQPTEPAKTETKAEPETIQYTYKQGDTFGQVLLDLGLSQPGQLWGPDGDVAYYTQQLRDQGIEGNVPIGKTITLVPRTKTTEVEFPSYLFNN